MNRNEFKLKLAEIIINDWRKVMDSDERTKVRFNLPGDVVDISYRAMQKAEKIMDDFYE